jgi:acyl-CoA reductase-like NAD-dependent aldehyde dehydrogenase
MTETLHHFIGGERVKAPAFGGTKKSSYGMCEQGFAAVEFYTQTKTAYSWS